MMIPHWLPKMSLLADTASGGGEVRELAAYELRRLGQFDDPRVLWLSLAAVLLLVVSLVIWFYRRESGALAPWMRWVLPGLRLVAMAGAVLFFLGPEKRIDRQFVTESRVLLLVDESQSMSVEDESIAGETNVSRGEAVTHALAESPMIENLRKRHDVSLAVFDEEVKRLASWQRQRDPVETTNEKVDASAEDSRTESPDSETPETPSTAWITKLQPRGGETRLGDALKWALEQHHGGPLAGVIVISDGEQNSGVEPMSMADRAARLQAPLVTIGVGSTQPRRNLRVLELNAPARVYPDDKATIRALIQGEGFSGRSVDVELFARDAAVEGSAGDRIGRQSITFDNDRQTVPVQFEIEPTELGRLVLELRIVAPTDDQYPGDNRREAEVEVVETRTRIMLIASGATRDYRFLRNQLRRDRHMTVDVWLQSAQPGVSQDADRILDSFPSTKEELYAYDCIVAFDPDWVQLDAQQVDLLESWVAEEAGGLIVVAGPIQTARWVQSPEHSKIRSLYPVEFQRRLTLLDDGLYGSKTPWPIAFTREGKASDFLWLADTMEESRGVWSRFPGVFGCYMVKGPKPGARVLARFSDPDASLSGELPVYFAEQFYGGGRVFYMGSGELWRLRSLDTRYFEVLYTQLIRHVSEGRLLRGSSRGRLLVERDRYSVGDNVVVRAQLSTANREPLVAARVTARVVGPGGQGQNLLMTADADRPGNFVGQFTTGAAGSYRLELPVPDALDEQLVRRIQVVVPNLEFEQTQRNEALLRALAKRTGGQYYASLTAAVEGRPEIPSAAQLLESRAELKTLRGTPDRAFTEWLNRILLAIIGGALCLEWLLRRLMKLA